MDKIDPRLEARLLSPQTLESRYCFLDLSARAGARAEWFLALAGWEACRPDYVVRRDHFPYHLLELVTAGSGTLVLDGKTYPLSAGAAFSCAPDMPIEIRSDAHAPLQKFFFSLGGGRAAGLRLKQAGYRPGTRRAAAWGVEVRELAEFIVREGRAPSPSAPKICRSLLDVLLLKLAEHTTARGADAERARVNFERCRSLIDSRTAELMSLDDIARASGLEASSICRLFRRFQKTSPYQYLLRRKMDQAAAFLLARRGLVKEAAAHVGLADPFHFSRLFRSVHGVPPSHLFRSGAAEE